MDAQPLQTSVFRKLYYQTYKQEHVHFRRKKGVSSACRTYDDCSAVLGLRANQRTDDEFAAAKRKLAKHIAVIRRLCGWERNLQMQSRRQMRLEMIDSVLHGIMDKRRTTTRRCLIVVVHSARQPTKSSSN